MQCASIMKTYRICYSIDETMGMITQGIEICVATAVSAVYIQFRSRYLMIRKSCKCKFRYRHAQKLCDRGSTPRFNLIAKTVYLFNMSWTVGADNLRCVYSFSIDLFALEFTDVDRFIILVWNDYNISASINEIRLMLVIVMYIWVIRFVEDPQKHFLT